MKHGYRFFISVHSLGATTLVFHGFQCIARSFVLTHRFYLFLLSIFRYEQRLMCLLYKKKFYDRTSDIRPKFESEPTV